MENEEIRGLIDKKAIEDQLEIFFLVQFWSSLYIIYLSITLGHSTFSWITSSLDQERKRKEKQRKYKESKERQGSTSFSDNTCR